MGIHELELNLQFLGEVPKNRTDLLPHYARLIATLNLYMPDVGAGVIELLDEELRYLQRKKLVKELDSTRLKVGPVSHDLSC